MNSIKLKSMLEQFYIEDIGDGDLSSAYLFPKTAQGQMQLITKMSGVFCGEQIIKQCLEVVDRKVVVECHVEDGDEVGQGQVLATLIGSVQSLLKAERLMLNLIQRMSGIATATAEAVQKIAATKAKVCDTRKTMPGLRMLDKYAVRAGGGFNHRFGLYDAVMLKDNHLTYAGSITEAVQRVRKHLGHTVKIEVEIETEAALKEAVKAKADIIMFDNCTPEEIKEWLNFVPASIVTEASGMITTKTIADYANAGVDYISLGYLTHSVQAFDISANLSVGIEVV